VDGYEAKDSRQWYVVQTKPKQEARAEANLQAWGLEVLAPKVRERRRSRGPGNTVYCVSLLFPGYLFARFDADRLLQKVRLTRGVHRVVEFAGVAAAVDDAIISTIQGRLQHDGFVRIAPPCPGDIVQIVDGPLRSLVGVFERELPGRQRVSIMLSTIGSSARVQVAKELIQKTTRFGIAAVGPMREHHGRHA
jgi:transcriptional antiterminator RfaH